MKYGIGKDKASHNRQQRMERHEREIASILDAVEYFTSRLCDATALNVENWLKKRNRGIDTYRLRTTIAKLISDGVLIVMETYTTGFYGSNVDRYKVA